MAEARLVLAVTDPGLRAILSAELGMAGEMPISTADHLDPSLGDHIRATALLIIEDQLIASAAHDWAETLRNQCWAGPIIVIVDRSPDDYQAEERVAVVTRRDAVAAILALVAVWQQRPGSALTPTE